MEPIMNEKPPADPADHAEDLSWRYAEIRARSSVMGSRRTKAKNLGSTVQTAVGCDGMIVSRLQCVPNAFSACDPDSTSSK
jgi:hypothetical protein